MTLMLGQSVLEFFRRLVILSAIVLYGSLMYLSYILCLIVMDYNFHLGLFVGVFAASLITFSIAYFVMLLLVRTVNSTNE